MAKRRHETFHFYECTLTGEKFKTTRKVDNQEDLVSVKAFYELNPELDDRPETVLKKLELENPESE